MPDSSELMTKIKHNANCSFCNKPLRGFKAFDWETRPLHRLCFKTVQKNKLLDMYMEDFINSQRATS